MEGIRAEEINRIIDARVKKSPENVPVAVVDEILSEHLQHLIEIVQTVNKLIQTITATSLRIEGEISRLKREIRDLRGLP